MSYVELSGDDWEHCFCCAQCDMAPDCSWMQSDDTCNCHECNPGITKSTNLRCHSARGKSSQRPWLGRASPCSPYEADGIAQDTCPRTGFLRPTMARFCENGHQKKYCDHPHMTLYHPPRCCRRPVVLMPGKELWSVDEAWFTLARDLLLSQPPQPPNQTPLDSVLSANRLTSPGSFVDLSNINPHCDLNRVLPTYMNISPQNFMMVVDAREVGGDSVMVDSTGENVLVRTVREEKLTSGGVVARLMERVYNLPQPINRPAMFAAAHRGFIFIALPWAPSCRPSVMQPPVI